MTHGRSGGREDAFKLHSGDHVGEFGILVVIKFGWIKGAKTRCQNNRTDVEDFRFLFLIKINSACRAKLFACTAFSLLDINTGIAVDAIL
jgi:hypothetical protein